MSTLPDNVQIFLKFNWEPFVSALNEWFSKIQETMRKWFPAISQAHRAEVKRVHTAYARTRRAHRRRKR